jgi:TrwC relaxase
VAVVATLSKGYDLDYIWKQVDRGPVKDAASYYIQASQTGGEPPGRWWGPGARALGFEPGQTVEREAYDLLFGERKAPDGTRLGRAPDGGRKAADLYAGLLAAEPHATAERKRELRTEAVKKARQSPLFFDLTISLSKSISLFHASLGENARLAGQAGDRDGDAYWSGLVGEVDEMIWQAVHAGFGYFQREAGYTRTGSHGTRVHGRETGQWHEADLAVAHWLQHTSRDGDMQLHVHSQIAHVVKTSTDGKWRAPDSLGYNEHIGAVAAIVSQHLAAAGIAADDKRYRVEMCPDCADRSCPDCRTHLRDIEAFDQMAGRMLQAAQASPAATASRPGPDRRAQPAADREAGQ